MREVLELVAAVMAFFLAAVGVSTGLAVRQVKHLNRVAPDAPSEAPLHWLVNPSRPAHLHRRLRRAAKMVVVATQPPAPARRRGRRRSRDTGVLDGAGRELIRRAVSLDARLVACDRGGPVWRRRQLPDLATEVSRLERSALRLTSLSFELRRHLDGLGVGAQQSDADLELGLDAIEAAIGELRSTPQAVRRADGASPPRAAG